MLYIGADHCGYKLKEFLKKYFDYKKIRYKDLGTFSEKPVDYPDIAFRVARRVAKENAKGILICKTGVGMCIAANKIKGIRAAVGYDNYSVEMSRKHNDTNVLCLRGANVNFKNQLKLAKIWLKTKFSGAERHKKRIAKIK